MTKETQAPLTLYKVENILNTNDKDLIQKERPNILRSLGVHQFEMQKEGKKEIEEVIVPKSVEIIEAFMLKYRLDIVAYYNFSKIGVTAVDSQKNMEFNMGTRVDPPTPKHWKYQKLEKQLKEELGCRLDGYLNREGVPDFRTKADPSKELQAKAKNIIGLIHRAKQKFSEMDKESKNIKENVVKKNTAEGEDNTTEKIKEGMKK